MSAKHCSVPLCVSNRKRSSADVSFHMFPKDEELRDEWIQKIRRNEGSSYKEMSATGYVCSKHFTKEDFAWNAGGTRKRLKRGTVPSKFPWTNTEKPPAGSGNVKKKSPVVKNNGLSNGTTTAAPPINTCTRERAQVLSLQDRVVKLQAKFEKKERDLSRKFAECELLTQRLSVERFGLNRFCRNDFLIQFYTGFPSYTQFISFFISVKPSDEKTSAYHAILHSSSVSGPMKDLQLVDELFMFMCCLHAGLLLEDLADRFNINITLVHRTVVTWCNYLYLLLAELPVWLSRETITDSTPVCFRELHPNTRVIIDFIEVRAEAPELLNPQTGSVGKSWCGVTTLKGLLGLAPNGAVIFLSELYAAPVSDAQVLTESGILKLLDHGDSVMANVGDLQISQLLEADSATQTEPLLCGDSGSDLSREEASSITPGDSEQMDTAVRQYLKSIISEVKRSRLFDGVIPCNLSGHIQQLWTVNCLLCNFREPVVL